MPDSSFVEGIKLVGGFLGIGTAIFTIWDRAFHSRPWALPFAVAHTDIGSLNSDLVYATDAYIRVTNPSKRDIIVHDIQQSTGGLFGVTFHSSVYGLIVSETGDRGTAIVPAGESRLFGLHYDSDLNNEKLTKGCWIWVKWYPVGALLPRVPVFFRTSAAAIEAYRRDVFHTAQAVKERQ